MKNYILLLTVLLLSLSTKAINISKIYIAGDAMPSGWTNSNAEEMKLVDESQGIFTWKGYVTTGEFKFLLNHGMWSNCLNATTNKETVILGKPHSLTHVPNYFESGNDFLFQIANEGVYKITVYTKEMSMIISKVENLEVPKNLWITGSALSNKIIKLTNDPNQIPGCFRYHGELKTGQLKLINTPTIQTNTKFYIPTSEDANIAGHHLMEVSNNLNAPTWNVTIADNSYKIKINTITNTLEGEIFIVRNNLFIIGGATEAGWDIKQAIALKNSKDNPNLFVFNGILKEAQTGEDKNMFKLLGQKDWEPITFHPKTQKQSLLTSKHIYKNYPGDNKWVIDLNKQGEYIIEVDMLNETIDAKYIGINKNTSHGNYQILSKKGKIEVRSKIKTRFDYVRLLDEYANTILLSENNKPKFTIGENLKKGVYLIELSQNKNVSVKKVVVK